MGCTSDCLIYGHCSFCDYYPDTSSVFDAYDNDYYSDYVREQRRADAAEKRAADAEKRATDAEARLAELERALALIGVALRKPLVAA